MKKALKWAVITVSVVLVLLLAGPLYMLATQDVTSRHLGTASRESAALAPPAESTEEAVVLVFAARTFDWRGAFAVHTWIATKPAGADEYHVHHVIGWRSGLKVSSGPGIPDRYWYGATPERVSDIRGDAAAALIPEILEAIKRYPYTHRYRAWPGPNSNTFVAWVAREVPGWKLTLPGLAVGKDFLGDFNAAAMAPSGTGGQFNLHGLIGVTLAVEEGLELNILGLTIGVDPLDLSLSVPGIGRLAADP